MDVCVRCATYMSNTDDADECIGEYANGKSDADPTLVTDATKICHLNGLCVCFWVLLLRNVFVGFWCIHGNRLVGDE